MPTNKNEDCVLVTSDLAPEVELVALVRQVILQSLKSEIKSSSFIDVKSAAVAFKVFEFL